MNYPLIVAGIYTLVVIGTIYYYEGKLSKERSKNDAVQNDAIQYESSNWAGYPYNQDWHRKQ